MKPYQQATLLFPVMKIRCPHCSEDSLFTLASKHYQRFGLALGKTFFLLCSRCDYERDVKDGKADAWQRLRIAYQGFETGELTREQFDDILHATDDPDLKEFIEESGVWICDCGEDNPSNFAACWNCGTEAKGPVRESKDASMDIGGGHPWES